MRTILSLMLTISTFFTGSGQDLKFTTGFIQHRDIVAQAIIVEVPYSKFDIASYFRKWMDEQYDYRLDGGKILEYRDNLNTYSAMGCFIPQISPKPMDLYLQVESGTNGKSIMRFYASFGFDSFLTRVNNPYEFRALYAVVKEFVKDYFMTDDTKPAITPVSLTSI